MTRDELRELFEAQASAAMDRKAKRRAAIFARLAATACNVPFGRLAELAELKRLAPVRFDRLLSEVGISFIPRHAPEFTAGMVNRLRAQGSSSGMYAGRNYRAVMSR